MPLVVVAAAAGLALRLWLLTTPAASVTSDEAVVGLMAKHLLGGDVRAFFWGQHYGGTLETMVVALLRAVAVPPILALKLTAIGLSAVAGVLVWRIGRKLASEEVARAAAAIFWLGPAAYVWLSTRQLGFYWTSLCLGLGLLLTGLRAVEHPDRRREWLGLGAVAGLGWWVAPTVLYFALPLGVWLLVRHRQVLPRAWPAVPAALLGAAPWLVYNVVNGFPSLESPGAPEQVGYAEGLGRLLWRTMPMVLGLRRVRTEAWLVPGLWVAYVAVAAVLVVVIVRRPRPPLLLVLGLVAFPFVYLAFPGRWHVGDGRYALFVWPYLALIVAWAADRRGRLVVAVAVFGLAVVGVQDIGVSRPPVHLGRDLAALERMGVDHLWADYWLAYRITFESDERIVSSPSIFSRYEPYERAVRADATPAVAFLRSDERVPRFRAAATAAGLRFREGSTEHLVVFRFRRPLPDGLVETAVP